MTVYMLFLYFASNLNKYDRVDTCTCTLFKCVQNIVSTFKKTHSCNIMNNHSITTYIHIIFLSNRCF